LKDSVLAIENCRRVIKAHLEKDPLDFRYSKYGDFQHNFGRIYRELYLLTKDRSLLTKAIEIYTDAINDYNKINLITKEAESYWQKAKLHDHLGKEYEATQDYEAAAKAYSKAAEKIPQLRVFYKEHCICRLGVKLN
jgi:tetratricopeptide (TPR) repeat protein